MFSKHEKKNAFISAIKMCDQNQIQHNESSLFQKLLFWRVFEVCVVGWEHNPFPQHQQQQHKGEKRWWLILLPKRSLWASGGEHMKWREAYLLLLEPAWSAIVGSVKRIYAVLMRYEEWDISHFLVVEWKKYGEQEKMIFYIIQFLIKKMFLSCHCVKNRILLWLVCFLTTCMIESCWPTIAHFLGYSPLCWSVTVNVRQRYKARKESSWQSEYLVLHGIV